MDILTVDFAAEHAAHRFAESFHNTGFGVIKNHPIDQALISEAYREWEAFFAEDTKHAYLYDKSTQDGYFPFQSENAKGATAKDLKEFFHVYPWGKYPDSVGPATMKLHEQLTQLAATLLDWIERETPPEIKAHYKEPLREMIAGSQRTLLRVLHYPALDPDVDYAGAIRAEAHGDINLITLIPGATEAGLQVKGKQGEWIDVPCDPNWIVVNGGDMLQACSQEYYPSTIHRVVIPEGEAARQSRLSMPLFLHPRDEVLLDDTLTANAYREQRLREIGLL